MRITVLGSGDAFNSGGRRHSGYFIEADQTGFLLDCGTTTLLALKGLKVPAERIDFIAISHMHGDHFGGLPFFFLESLYQEPRTRPLVITGPPNLQTRVEALYRAMFGELAERPLTFPIVYQELRAAHTASVGGVELTPFAVPHLEKETCFGYRVHVDGKTILYSGDCGWNENLVQYSQGTDVFICECCYFGSQTPFHLSYPELVRERDRLGCKRLVLSHLGREVLARQAEVRFECAHDGFVLEV